ncbi:MAG: CNNM domain-containing protein, partial [Alphaproteobacteria bacterium]|nr:CNNM domain-containing protein [Alphaproteobacteria bacterium]
MTTTLVLTLAAILVLLLTSAFFSGSETALTAASRSRLHHLAQRGNARARLVERLVARRERMIGAILLGNNAVNILASALATSLMIGLFGEAGVAYATIAMTAVIFIFAEVLPKTAAIRNAERTALTVAPVLRPAVSV